MQPDVGGLELLEHAQVILVEDARDAACGSSVVLASPKIRRWLRRGAGTRFATMPRIEGYSFGRVVVDGGEETRDLIVLPGRVVEGWWRREGHELVLEDLDEVLGELPERLVVGTDAFGRLQPDPEMLVELRQRGIEVECLPTGDAVRRYGKLDPARTAAALHLTC